MNRALLTLKIGRSDDFPDTALASINRRSYKVQHSNSRVISCLKGEYA